MNAVPNVERATTPAVTAKCKKDKDTVTRLKIIEIDLIYV